MSTSPASVDTSRPLGHWLGLGVLLTAGIALLLVWWIGFEELSDALLSLSPTWLAVAVASEAAALACLTRVYRAIFRAVHGELPAREAMTVALGSFSLSQILPGGGAAGGVFAAHRLARRSDAITGTAVVVLFGTTSMTTLGLIISAGATATAVATGQHRGVAIAAGVLTLLLVAAMAVGAGILSAPQRRHAISDWIADVTRRDEATRLEWRDALDRQSDLLGNPARLLPAMAWSAANWSFDIAVMAAIARAAGLDVPLVAIVVAYGVANLANTIPLTPGGIGLVEAGVTGTLVAMGASAGSAAVVAIGYRLVADLLPVAVAGPIALDGLRNPPDLEPDVEPDLRPDVEPDLRSDVEPGENVPDDTDRSSSTRRSGNGQHHDDNGHHHDGLGHHDDLVSTGEGHQDGSGGWPGVPRRDRQDDHDVVQV